MCSQPNIVAPDMETLISCTSLLAKVTMLMHESKHNQGTTLQFPRQANMNDQHGALRKTRVLKTANYNLNSSLELISAFTISRGTNKIILQNHNHLKKFYDGTDGMKPPLQFLQRKHQTC